MSSKKDKISQIEQLPYSMKGYELYTWEKDGKENFKLSSGTNLQKTVAEIINPKFEIDSSSVNIFIDSEEELKKILSKFPNNTYIIVNDGIWWGETDIGISEGKNLEDIQELTKQLNILLTK